MNLQYHLKLMRILLNSIRLYVESTILSHTQSNVIDLETIVQSR